MTDAARTQKSSQKPDRGDHLANERTFLAWIRTSLGIMAFGFVLEKFALFLKKLQYLVKDSSNLPAASSDEFSSIFGIVIVAMGVLLGVLAFVRYKKVEQEINEGTYEPSLLLDIMVAMGILIIGIFLIFYMIRAT